MTHPESREDRVHPSSEQPESARLAECGEELAPWDEHRHPVDLECNIAIAAVRDIQFPSADRAPD